MTIQRYGECPECGREVDYARHGFACPDCGAEL